MDLRSKNKCHCLSIDVMNAISNLKNWFLSVKVKTLNARIAKVKIPINLYQLSPLLVGVLLKARQRHLVAGAADVSPEHKNITAGGSY